MALSWRVFREDFNKGTIEYYDIFKGTHLQEEVEALMHSAHSKEEFAAMLKKKLLYHYWARSEHEVVITSSPPYINVENIDEVLTSFNNTSTKIVNSSKDVVKINSINENEMKLEDTSGMNGSVTFTFKWAEGGSGGGNQKIYY